MDYKHRDSGSVFQDDDLGSVLDSGTAADGGGRGRGRAARVRAAQGRGRGRTGRTRGARDEEEDGGVEDKTGGSRRVRRKTTTAASNADKSEGSDLEDDGSLYLPAHRERQKPLLPAGGALVQPVDVLVCCDQCEMWFSATQMGLDPATAPDLPTWHCSACTTHASMDVQSEAEPSSSYGSAPAAPAAPALAPTPILASASALVPVPSPILEPLPMPARVSAPMPAPATFAPSVAPSPSPAYPPTATSVPASAAQSELAPALGLATSHVPAPTVCQPATTPGDGLTADAQPQLFW